jgi:hypothetical protein
MIYAPHINNIIDLRQSWLSIHEHPEMPFRAFWEVILLSSEDYKTSY